MEKSHNRRIVKFLLLFVLLILCWVAGRQYDIRLDEIQQKFQGYPLAASGLLFVGSYVALTTLIWFGPKDILRTAAGVLFGATISTVFVIIGEIINSVIMFHTSRFFGRELVENRLGGRKADLDKVAHSRSVLGVFTVRINLLIPIRFTDLGYGLTNISFGKYLLPATLALVPRIYWQQYFLAHGGAAVLKSVLEDFRPELLTNYWLENRFFLIYTICYILSIVILTAAVSILKVVKLKKGT